MGGDFLRDCITINTDVVGGVRHHSPTVVEPIHLIIDGRLRSLYDGVVGVFVSHWHGVVYNKYFT